MRQMPAALRLALVVVALAVAAALGYVAMLLAS
jgi:hypothetical protein